MKYWTRLYLVGFILFSQNVFATPRISIKASVTPAPNTIQETSETTLAIPFQISPHHSLFNTFFEKASEAVQPGAAHCAKFVNEIFWLRFGRVMGERMYGSAWELQLKKENQKFLTLEWRVPENEVHRDNNLYYPYDQRSQRVEHFRKLYEIIEAQERPIGVIGFLYRFSNYLDYVSHNPQFLPQTHVAFLSGKKTFYVENKTNESKTVEEILTEAYGVIHDFERDFVSEKLNLDLILLPGGKYAYTDYLIEEHFRDVMQDSLLGVYLRKHRNNKVMALLRPMSFSRLSDDLLLSLETQDKQLKKLGPVDFVKAIDFTADDVWRATLKDTFGMDRLERSLVVPVPKTDSLAQGE